MATIQVKFRPSSIDGKAGTVYYQVIHQRKVRQVSTDVHIRPEQWDSARRQILSSEKDRDVLQNRIDSGAALLRQIVRDLENRRKETGRTYTAAEVVRRFRAPERNVSVTGFMQEQICFLSACGRIGTAVNYRKALESLRAFPGGGDLRFPEITPAWADLYQDHLRRRGLSKNSVSFHLRILRAVYNKAVRRQYAEPACPFRDACTGIADTRRRAVGEEIIARLLHVEIEEHSPMELARDLFLFSFYTRGMAFVDMAYLRRENIETGMLCYIRRKTGRLLRVRIEACIRDIIDRYAEPGRPWLFPILKSEDPAASYTQYRVALGYYNRLLKRLSRRIGLEHGLSFYTARHSWATMARNRNVPVSVISAGMGHSSERTTQIYLTSLENALIDNANHGLLTAFGKLASATTVGAAGSPR